MQLHRLTLSVLGCLMLSAPLALAQNAPASNSLIAKQLAGPPSEFALMAAPDPAEATIHSKSALIPIDLRTDKSGGLSWQGELPVHDGRARFLVFAGAHGSWKVDLTSPSGTTQKAAASLARDTKQAQFGMEQALHAADYYALDGVEQGVWRVQLSAASKSSAARGFLLIEGNASTELASYQSHKRQLLGERIGLVAMLSAAEGEETPKLGRDAGHIERATLRVTSPDGTIEKFAMFDDGKHDDGLADDGRFGADFLAKSTGHYVAQVSVQGVDRAGNAVLRSAEHVVPIVDASLRLSSHKASAVAAANDRVMIEVPVVSDKQEQHYRAYAEVWGTGVDGSAIPVAWVGGMVTPAAGKLGLGFDERWAALAGAGAPFELRNLRIEDPDSFITLTDAKRLPLTLPALRVKAAPSQITIDDSMRMGPRPPRSAISKGTGSRLLLVHGYCSGGVWPASQFTNDSTFLDANKNRSHDAFARLIQSFGNTWNSFGVVAHSQGGAASLHLYNYYWSGLDNAGAGRLIQSVGTPYKGTNLSGVLAALGGIFGVGCGTNSDLTYSGASSWLAGISNTSRAKVNYYTTAFRSTNWWTNDYCNFASDLVLSDPEDGTTEKVNGQLSGGVNRGHVTGQCHTAGMRDPAQYLDSGRNATMNSNAAR
jgi:hypothetical protein